MHSCDTGFPALTHLYCWMKIESCCVFSFQGSDTMTPQRAGRRRMMPSPLEDTMSTCGTSALKTVPPPVTPTASPTPTHPRWTVSEMWTRDSSAPCSSANQVSVWWGKGQLWFVKHADKAANTSCKHTLHLVNFVSLYHLLFFKALTLSLPMNTCRYKETQNGVEVMQTFKDG